MAAVLADIAARAPQARIVVVGYPDMFPLSGGCWPAVPITDGDIAYLRGIELQLNAMLAADAKAADATFVNTYTPTIGHDFCQPERIRDVEGLLPGSVALPFHPNARGQAAIAAAVLAAAADALTAGRVAAAAHRAAVPRARLGELAGQLIGQPQQRVRGAGDDVLRDVGDPGPARPSGPAQQVERLARPEPVPLGEHADGLLNPDPRRQGML